MLRHEQQSIRMALATVKHHSSGKVHTTYGAPRSQTTATRARRGRGPRAAPRPTGTEATSPGDAAGALRLRWPGRRWWQPRAGYVAARAPLLAVSSLRGADGVDDTAVKYLLRAELKKKKEEEEEERKQELADEALDDKLDAEMDALMSIGSERLNLSTKCPSHRAYV